MESRTTSRQRRLWERAAPGYDRSMVWFERNLLRDGRGWLGERTRGNVLLVAVGTGRDLPYLHDDVTSVTGIDLSPPMLDQARRRAAALGRDADLREGDAENLPFGDASFDTVTCVLSLCTIPRPEVALAEAKRVLKPGGRLLLLDHIGSTWPPVRLGQWLVEAITVPSSGEHFTRRQLGTVRDLGLEVVERDRYGMGMVERVHAVKP
ncbi:class I SAM-dependent methyltransferase [Myceligenerans xiligouense]|uniref:Phosphatidylethanolamine N-methyltransferase /phosphatidyl-N-methylethanolamine N-methyltransferase n=1 Tax=Myceligenerans xiligouense TaxID=253184 RepID=A0A3N4YKK6_9MICO|nr:class I SAM-dependent methyltransferase [Myceligenerans xiligouense]RPF21263.1 phosphatidylethanolamine N-methyltransferase /phosphatidyl-N-methylethanolamine N-methyltransferase [Myceligenerans xiligouense]